jgi:HEAT repeat protein
MSSEKFERFKSLFFGNPFEAAHNGIDPKVLLSLNEDEKEKAQKLLLDAIRNSEEDRHFIGIGHLKSKEAVPIIKNRLLQGFKWVDTKVWAAWALWQTNNDSDAVKIVIEILKDKNQGEYTRTGAIIALRDFGNRKDVLSALIESYSDEKDDSLVGLYAFEAVKHILSSDPNIRDLISIILDAGSTDRHKTRKSEIKKLTDLIRRKMRHY